MESLMKVLIGLVVGYFFVAPVVLRGCKVIYSYLPPIKEKFLACLFEVFGERIVDNQYQGDGNYLQRRGWRITIGRRVYYHYFEDLN